MSLKRQRPPDASSIKRRPLSKRPKVDLSLANLWEQLVDESEEIRLNAVYELLTNHLDGSDPETAKTIAIRLFRGLCSSRKNARQGFYVALMGALSMDSSPFRTYKISLTTTISLLKAQTSFEPGTSGQDERDHHYGQLLGCKALLESKTLWEAGDSLRTAWSKIMDILSKLMTQKPWIRAESISVVCAAIAKLADLKGLSDTDLAILTSDLFQHLKDSKLLNTIEGIGAWLTLRQVMPHHTLPKDIWNSESPIHKTQLQNLKKMLLGKHGLGDKEEAEESISGTSVWSPRLHPTWSVMLRQLDNTHLDDIRFEDFWQAVIDNGLFDAASTPERKYTGFLVLECALREVKSSQIASCFSQNLMVCLIQSLRNSDEAYLRKVALKVFENYKIHAKEHNSEGVHNVAIGLLRGSDYADFDILTKSEVIASLLLIKPFYHGSFSDFLIHDLRTDPRTERPLAKIAASRKNILSVFSRAMLQAIRDISAQESNVIDFSESSWTKIQSILASLFDLRKQAHSKSNEMVAWDEMSYAVLQEKIALTLESLLAAGSNGKKCFFLTIAGLRKIDVEAEDTIQTSLEASWRLFQTLLQDDSILPGESAQSKIAPSQSGLELVLGLLLHEVYDGDVSAIEMLEDITSTADSFLTGQDQSKLADQILEIVISFLSKPSKLRRRACSLIFDAFAPYISSEGLQSLCHILTTKESRDGQQELFENEQDDSHEDLSDEEEAVESSEDDSDVEIVSADSSVVDGASDDEKASLDDATSATDTNESSSPASAGSNDEDDELIRFEGALAAALGTRKFNEADITELDAEVDSNTSSDSDMSDSEMMELDDKLAEVFRNQQDQTSLQRVRKEERKHAKENVINLKNRAVDLIELYFRSQHARGSECLDLVLSTLQMAQTTGTPQLANRGIGTVKSYVQRSKGTKLPKMESSKLARERLKDNIQTLLRMATHQDSSNALIEVAGQVNVVLCKLLLEAGEKDVDKVVARLSDEHGFRQNVTRKALEAFWSRYDAWSRSSQGAEVGKKEDVSKRSELGQTVLEKPAMPTRRKRSKKS